MKKTTLKTPSGQRLFACFISPQKICIHSEPDYDQKTWPEDNGDIFTFGGTDYRGLRTWVDVAALGDSDFGFIHDAGKNQTYLTRTDGSFKDAAPTHRAKAAAAMINALAEWAKASPEELQGAWDLFLRDEAQSLEESTKKQVRELRAAANFLKTRLARVQETSTRADFVTALDENGPAIKYAVKVEVSKEY